MLMAFYYRPEYIFLCDAATLSWQAFLGFPQQTEELLHLGYFHFCTLRRILTPLGLRTHTHTQTDAKNK